MRQASSNIIIHAPVEDVWAVLGDLSTAEKCFPGVTKSYYLSEKRSGIGAARHCDIKSGAMTGYLRERITAWQEGKAFSLELFECKGVPYKKMEADFSLDPCPEGTRFTQTIRFSMKGGPLAPLLGLVGSILMEKQLPRMVQGVKACVEAAVPK